MRPLLLADNLTFLRSGKQGEGPPLIKGISLALDSAEFIGVIGANGAGKTTLFRLLSGLLQPASGRLFIAGQPIESWQPRELAANICGVFGDPETQLVASTVYDEFCFSFDCAGVPPEKRKDLAREWLGRVGLGHIDDDHPVNRLSGGEQQRLVLAAVLVLEPRCLLLDEALEMLDAGAEERILSLLEKRVEAGGTVMMTVHRMDQIECCSRVLRIDDGALAGDWDRQTFLDKFSGERSEIDQMANIRLGLRQAGLPVPAINDVESLAEWLWQYPSTRSG